MSLNWIETKKELVESLHKTFLNSQYNSDSFKWFDSIRNYKFEVKHEKC